MAVYIGDMIVCQDRDRGGECVKGKIVDIWKNNDGEITDYFVSLDSGLYTHVKPNYPGWFKIDECLSYFTNNRLSLSFLVSRDVLALNK